MKRLVVLSALFTLVAQTAFAEEERRKRSRRRSSRAIEVAARLADDVECDKKIKAVLRSNKKAAWALLISCINQDKYRKLSELLSKKWRKRFGALTRAQQTRLAAHVLATAGKWTEQDFHRLKQSNLRLITLDEARGWATRYPGYVIFRGRVVNRMLQKNGLIRLYIAEMQREEHTGSRDVWTDTGSDVEAAVGDLPLLVRKPNEYVFLATVRQAGAAESFVDIVDVYTPGVTFDGLGP